MRIMLARDKGGSSVGSRFAKLESINEMDGQNMETKGDDSEEAAVSGAHMVNDVTGLEGNGGGTINKSNGQLKKVVLKASHAEVTEESRAV